MLMGMQFAYGTPFWNPRGAPLGAMRRPARRRASLRGLGDVVCTDNGDGTQSCIDNSTGTASTSSSGSLWWDLTTAGATPTVIGSATSSSPTNVSAWSNFVTALSKDASNIYKAVAGPVPAGCTVMTAANGTTYQSCGASSTAASSLTSLFSGSSSTTWLMLALLGLGVALIAGKH